MEYWRVRKIPATTPIRVDTEVASELKQFSQSKKIKVKDVIKYLWNLNKEYNFFDSNWRYKVIDESRRIPTLKEIAVKYRGRCSKCGRIIEVGEKALWGVDEQKRTILICIDCQIENETDKAIVSRLIKKRRLEREIKALNNQLKILASKYEEYKFLDDFNRAYNLLRTYHKLFTEFQNEVGRFSAKEEIERIERMIELLRKMMEIMKDFETYYQEKIKNRIKKEVIV